MTPIERRAALLAVLNDQSATLRRQIEAASTDAALDDIADRLARMSECLTPTHHEPAGAGDTKEN